MNQSWNLYNNNNRIKKAKESKDGLILFSNITLNSGNQNSDSELLNNSSDFEIEEILENDDSQNESE